ncbi:hypothetical protein KKC60_05025, partial [Patescibacteria group bacterium]|nr:hypothetical protein [Patescibacteria group bacterium]
MPEKGTESIEQSIKNEVEKKEALELLRSEVMVEINRDLGDRFTSGEIVSPDLNAVAFVEADRREENDGMFRVVAGDKESEIVEYVGEVTWGKNSKSMVCSVQPAGEDYPMACFNFVTDRKHFENVWMPEKMKVRPDGENYGCVVESNTGCACNFLIDGEEV